MRPFRQPTRAFRLRRTVTLLGRGEYQYRRPRRRQLIGNGTAGDDNLSYTPTGTAAGTLTLAGLNATFNLTSVGTLSLDAGAGVNTVTVNGNASGNSIGVAPRPCQYRRDGRRPADDQHRHGKYSVARDRQRPGDDAINVTGIGGPALTVNGGDPTASDTLTVTANGDTTVNFGADPTSGTIATTSDPAIAFSGIEAISLTSATAAR